ncbi:nucleoside recognition domain-containing protein [Shewanella sp. A32]|uniref:nucleoside recognition domain-containing protein n=1 Tax=Shewanella sp. A32 TaxID=3031327 RepID=UPI0023B8AE82|nr:spore maturation protein [Shewanella sp. A32]MDF0535280.1 nucleoside recognition domain-containing protein [Shewanella sp. A32]
MLNRVWSLFFIIAAAALAMQCLTGHTEVVSTAVAAMFESAKLAANIAIGLIGVLTLWMGLMRVGEKAGVVSAIAWMVEPLLRKLMPEVPKGHPAFGSVTMNLTANMLGLDIAATPLGLKAMHDLQSLNPTKSIASNAQILFLVLNTSSVTLIPVTIFLYRAQQGAAAPAEVFLPILLATLGSSLAGLLAVALVQRLPLWNLTVAAYAAVILGTLGAVVGWLLHQDAERIGSVSTVVGNGVLLLLVFSFVLIAVIRKVAVYDEFIEGAKSGFEQAIQLIPYLLAMLLAIAMLRASGALDYLLNGISGLVNMLGFDSRFVDALPTALMKPLSGSGARAMMLETMSHYGVDSFAGRLASVFQGSTETTFYVLAVYFGSVGIRNGRYALACGLLADFAGIVSAIIVCYWFYG